MKKIIVVLFITTLLVSACSGTGGEVTKKSDKSKTVEKEEKKKDKKTDSKQEKGSDLVRKAMDKNIRTIYLAGGCFWGVEGYFSMLSGVVDAQSGYANGKTEDTDYYSIAKTGHAETVKVDYDISRISLEEILLHYFKIIDPKSLNKQGNDVGTQYRTGVYYISDEQKQIVDKVFKFKTEEFGEIAVESEELNNFILAEDYHQDYLERNPNGYCHIDLSMAREPLYKQIYVNPDEAEIKEKLDPLSYDVLRNSGTERAGTSELEEEYRKGIYVDKITGEPLFASKDKFDSGCGWPSFSKPILTDKIKYLEDNKFGMKRIEVRSDGGDNHLGHVFNDGPVDKGGLRYCINGASLRFIPFEEMDKEGYSEYKVFCE